MSISIDNIYCSHEFNNTTRTIIKRCVHPVYSGDRHLLLHITDSIHFNTLIIDDFGKYNSMLQEHPQPEHSAHTFKELLNSFSLEKMDKIKIKYDGNIKKYIIVDGVHRLSILVFKDLLENNNIPSKYLEIN